MSKRSLIAGLVVAAAAVVVAFPAAAFAQTPTPAPSPAAPDQDDAQIPGGRGGPGSDQSGPYGPGFRNGRGGPGGPGFRGGSGGNTDDFSQGAGPFRRRPFSPLGAMLATVVGLALLGGAGALGYRVGLNKGRGESSDAQRLLDSRYARGEIDTEEYQQRRVDLAAAH